MCVCARVCVTRAHTSSCVCERSLTPGLPAASAKKAKEQPHPDEPAANSKGFGAPVQRVRDELQRERSRAEPPRDGKTEGMTWRERDVRASIILWPKCGSDGSCFRLVPGGDVVDCGQGCLKDDRSCWHRGDRAGAEQTPFCTSCASPVQPSSLNDDDDGDDEEGEQSGGEGGAEIETEGSPHGDDAHTHTHTDAPRAQAQEQQEAQMAELVATARRRKARARRLKEELNVERERNAQLKVAADRYTLSAREATYEAFVAPVSRECTLVVGKRSTDPVELLSNNAKYTSICINDEDCWVAGEAVSHSAMLDFVRHGPDGRHGDDAHEYLRRARQRGGLFTLPHARRVEAVCDQRSLGALDVTGFLYLSEGALTKHHRVASADMTQHAFGPGKPDPRTPEAKRYMQNLGIDWARADRLTERKASGTRGEPNHVAHRLGYYLLVAGEWKSGGRVLHNWRRGKQCCKFTVGTFARGDLGAKFTFGSFAGWVDSSHS